MDNKELDELLGQAKTPWESNVSTAVNDLVEATRVHTLPQPAVRKSWSRSLVWGSVAAGAIFLTAGRREVA